MWCWKDPERIFITYLYKEHIRKKNLECDISLRLHYSLVFDLSPTLRQIASIPLFFVTRNAKPFSVYFVKQCTESIRSLIFYDLRQYSIFGKHMEHYRSIVISLSISYAIINSPSGAMDMVLACGARGSACESRSEHIFFRQTNF